MLQSPRLTAPLTKILKETLTIVDRVVCIVRILDFMNHPTLLHSKKILTVAHLWAFLSDFWVDYLPSTATDHLTHAVYARKWVWSMQKWGVALKFRARFAWG